MSDKDKFLFYTAEDGAVKVEVLVEWGQVLKYQKLRFQDPKYLVKLKGRRNF